MLPFTLALSRREGDETAWSQTARRLPAKQFEVGSTPAGVSQ